MSTLRQPYKQFVLYPVGEINDRIDYGPLDSQEILNHIKVGGPLYSELAAGSIATADPMWPAIFAMCVVGRGLQEEMLVQMFVESPDYWRFLADSWDASKRHSVLGSGPRRVGKSLGSTPNRSGDPETHRLV